MCREDPLLHPALLMMGSDQYCLKWNNHWANLIRVFNSLLQSETFVDVTLACEGRHLKAHRLVLSACSPYFKELLVAHPDKHPIVILKDVRYSELRTLVEFIYNGEVSVEQNDLAALLCTARELQIKGLADNRLPGAPSPHGREGGEVGKYTLTPASTLGLPTTTSCSTSPPPLDGNIKSGSPRRKVGSEDRPPPPLAVFHPSMPPSSFATSHFSAYHSRPASREASPVHKRRRVSVDGCEEDGEASENSKQAQTDPPNGHFPHQDASERPLPFPLTTTPSGIRIVDQTRREDNNNTPPTWDSDKPSPSIAKISVGVPVATASTSTNSPGEPKGCDDDDDDRAHVSIQSPEVILEEGETGVVSSGPPSTVPSPSLAGSSLNNSSITATPLGGPLAPSGPLPPQMALLHQALALGYHPLQHYFPPGLLEQQQQQQQQQQQHPGVTPPKDIMHFLDVMKALPPSARLPLAALGAPAGVGGTSSLSLGLPVVTGATSSSTASTSTSREKSSGSGSGITCHICAMILPSAHHLEEHIRIHEEEKPYKCDQCGQRYKYQSAFQRHQEQNHTAKLPGDKPFRCSVCGQCFKYHKSFTKHRSNHDALDRIMKAESEEGRLLHRGIHESYLQKLLVSESSKSESEASVTLKEESMETQQQEEGAERPSTSNPTSFNAALLRSAAAAAPENGTKTFEDRDEEEEEGEEEDGEMEEENRGKFVYCVKCKLTFRDVGSFEDHCRSSAECSLDTLREVKVSDGPGLSRPPSVASSPQASPRLSPSSISGPPRSPLPASTPLAMPSPPSTTTPVGGLPPSASVAMSTAAAGTTSVTPGTSTPPGPGPGQNTLIKLEPRSALMLSHAPLTLAPDPRGDEERPFKCQFCQKGFKGRENLKLHIRTHTGEKPYNCGVCGKAFGGRSDMNRHLRIHTGEKPYPCKVCGKKFARADYLSKHITTHLGVPFAKPVHSLQQSLQNLENMQNLQNLHKLQNMSNE